MHRDGYRRPAPFLAGILFLALIPAKSMATCDVASHCIPQPTCEYAGTNTVSYPPLAEQWRNLELSGATHCEAPPAPGTTMDSFFDITYRIQRSTDTGTTWATYTGSTTGTIRIFGGGGGPDYGVELLELDMTNSALPCCRIRECPSRPSIGHSKSTPSGGGFTIDSFFDVFTELTLDGGQTWTDSDQPLHVDLRAPQPTAARASTWGALKLVYR